MIMAISNSDNVSEPLDIYNRALSRYGIGPQLDMFIEEAAEAIQSVQYYRRGRCDMDTVCGELADLQVMLEQIKIVFGIHRFEKIFVENIHALDEKLNAEEHQ